MSGSGRGGPEAGESVVRAVMAIVCTGGAMLMIALVLAMDRWLIG